MACWNAYQHWSNNDDVSAPLTTGVDWPVGVVNHSGVDSPDPGSFSPPSCWDAVSGALVVTSLVGVGLMI